MPQIVMHTDERIKVGDAFAPAESRGKRNRLVMMDGSYVYLVPEGSKDPATPVHVDALLLWWVRV